MLSHIKHSTLQLSGWAGKALLLIVWAMLAISQASAQSTITDGSTPSAIKAGAPAGSYALSGFETVNPYNGGLNFTLPLVQLGGRGSVSHTINLKIEQKWRVKRNFPGFGSTVNVTHNSWEGVQSDYGPGVMNGRLIGTPAFDTCPSELPALTRLTFTASDGTEYEFRDLASDGKPESNTFTENAPNECILNGSPRSRGKVWVTRDGSSMTFLSDQNIYDFYGNEVNGIYYVGAGIRQVPSISGYLFMKDGTRYRIDDNLVRWIADRNGNRMTFEYEGSKLIKVTDSLNRVVTIEYINNQTGEYDRIRFYGFAHQQREILINRKRMNNMLRNTHTNNEPFDSDHPWLYSDLFPEINNLDIDNVNRPVKVSSVVLPDLRTYKFFYNVYGELARVELPTGGAFEYDWHGAINNGNPSGVIGVNGDPQVYRRVIERRVYKEKDPLNVGAGTLEGRQTFSKPEQQNAPSLGYVQIDHLSADTPAQLQSREWHYYHGSARASLGQEPEQYSDWLDGREHKTEIVDSNASTLLQRTKNFYNQTPPNNWWAASVTPTPAFNPFLEETVMEWPQTNPVQSRVSKKRFAYDDYNNQTEVWEYDFGTPNPPLTPLRHTVISYLTSGYDTYNTSTPSASVHIRNLVTQQLVYEGNDTTTPKAKATYEYDNYSSPNQLVDRAAITSHAKLSTGPYSPPVTHTTAYTTRGNATKVSKWLLPLTGSPTELATTMKYDIAGNVVKTTDALGRTAEFFYADAFGIADAEAENNVQGEGATELQNGALETFALVTSVKNTAPFNHISYTQFDYWTGNPVNSKDANNIITKGSYDNDLLDRAKEVVFAVGTPLERRTRFLYDDGARTITTLSDQTTLADDALKSVMVYDGLGRTVETRSYEPGGYSKTTQTYDALGRPSRSDNPERSFSDPADPSGLTKGYSVTAYDGLSRVKTVETFDKNNALTGRVMSDYNGTYNTVTDQAGKKRRSLVDGLGRLIRVDEPNAAGALDDGNNNPVQSTYYTYDVLDNLTEVTQGVQSRSFAYDSLKRLIYALNPEQTPHPSLNYNGKDYAVKYEYDNNSNLVKKTDSRVSAGQLLYVEYTYDQLNRLKKRQYFNDPQNTPTVNYNYDNLSNGVGKLIQISSSVSTTDFNEFDVLGRVKKSTQTTSGAPQPYETTYEYNLAGQMTYEKYPSGREVFASFDTAGRLTRLEGQHTPNNEARKDYASTMIYTAHGRVKSLLLGNNKYEHTNFNSRLQPTQIGLGTSVSDSSLLKLDYTYGVKDGSGTLDPTKNNGNIESQQISINGVIDVKQSYLYDSLNRLESAEEKLSALPNTQQWKQAFSYDRFGNRTFGAGTTITEATIAFATSTNRIITSGYVYDNAGSVTQEPSPEGSRMYTYDGENHQVSFTLSNQTTYYRYDGDKRRVKKENPDGSSEIFVYNALGQLIAEYTTNAPQPVGGGGTSYLTTDHLDSTRLVSKGDGSVKARYDYLPFGGELTVNRSGSGYGGADATRQRFTGQERDQESKLNFMQARYSSSPTGRFMNTDSVMGSTTNPQSLNLYCYVINNPMAYVDPTGHAPDSPQRQRKEVDYAWYWYGQDGIPPLFQETASVNAGIVDNSANVQIQPVSANLGGQISDKIVTGALIGAGAGAIIGGAYGGAVGAGIGTFVIPGFGTVGGGIGGGVVGAVEGAIAGAIIGAAIGAIDDLLTDDADTQTGTQAIPIPDATTADPDPPAFDCNNPPNGYDFKSPDRILNMVRSELGVKNLTFKQKKGVPTTDGPCPGIGRHYVIMDGGAKVGSVVCCPCPTGGQRCKFIPF